MAANTDLVRKSTPNFATTLSGAMLISDTSMSLTSATGLPTATAITLVIDATDPSSGASTPTLKEVVTGTLSGTTVSNLLRGQDSTTQQAHASGANVVMWVTSNLWNDFCTAFLVNHTQLGAFNSSLSFTTPSISTPTITSGGTWSGSPTLSTPTIADFTNATHTHAGTSSGGQLTSTAFAANAVTTTAINNGAVTADKLGLAPTTNVVATSETTTSTSYTALATAGATTITIGANGLALVILTCNLANDTATARSIMGYAVSGATTTAATDTKALWSAEVPTATAPSQMSAVYLLTGLASGSTTFTSQFRVTTGTGTFVNRNIAVIPL